MTKPEPKITFAMTNTESASKVRLTQTLFRQVIDSPLYKSSQQPQGRIIGFVNYFWKGCTPFVYGLYTEGGIPKVSRRAVYWDSSVARIHLEEFTAECYHILWVTPGGELRRCVMKKHGLPSDIQQVFLGGVLFA